MLIAKDNLILAPLAGVSDAAYRYLCKREGAALSFTEMVSAKGLYYNSEATKELLEIKEREGDVGIQLFGSEPEMIAFAVEKLADYPNVCFDINMGCPVPKVYKNGEGSALLKNTELAKRIVEAAADASSKTSKKPVTVKMRLNSRAEDLNKKPSDVVSCDIEASINFAKALEDAGAQMISVHGRTREQYYSGNADWDAIKEIKKHVSIPVIGNGDVRSFEDAKRMLQYTACDGVMIGRGSMGNPWIFRKDLEHGKSDITSETLRETMNEHFELLLSSKGRRAVLEMRKYFSWYTKGLTGAAQLRDRINNAKDEKEIFDLINQI